MKGFLLIFLGMQLLSSLTGRILNTSSPMMKIKIFHHSPSRHLSQKIISKELSSDDYLLDDEMETTKKSFIRRIQSNNIKPKKSGMQNLFIGNRVLLEDITKDFEARMKIGLDSGCPKCTTKPNPKRKGAFEIIGEDGKPFADIIMTRRDPDPKVKDDHNVSIMMDNNAYSGEFEKKQMKGLSIIETEEKHRGEIEVFVGQTVMAFLEPPELEEDSGDKSKGLEGVQIAVDAMMAEIQDSLTLVHSDPQTGYYYEKKSEDNLLTAVLLIYPVSDGVFGIHMKTRMMEEFEMQIREYLRVEDVTSLKDQVINLLDNLKKIVPPSIEKITAVLNGLVAGVNNPVVVKDCADGLKFDDTQLAKMPNMTFMKADTGDGGFDEFDDFGGGFDEEDDQEEPKEEEIPLEKICMWNFASVTLIDMLDMPYLFFSFSNKRMMIENFIPAVNEKDTEAKLTEAFKGIVDLNTQVETAVAKNKDDKGQAIDNPKIFVVEDLEKMIAAAAKEMKLKEVKEPKFNKVNFMDGTVLRIEMFLPGNGTRVRFHFPSKMFKDKKDASVMTNEFLFEKNISYDAVTVFKHTLDQFKKDVKSVKQ